MEDEEFDAGEYSLTAEGVNTIINVISEFCHGFTIEEIAANGERTADEIKVMLFCFIKDYVAAYGGNDYA